MDGSKPPLIGLKPILVVLVDEGFGDAMEQLKDVFNLLLFDTEAYCLLNHLEQSFSQFEPQMPLPHTPSCQNQWNLV
jgi:hypothetical protein